MEPSGPSPADLLCTIAEPTRLRLLNCLAGSPLFVLDLQAILALPQPTVSRHLTVLRHAGIVRAVPCAQYMLYQIRWDGPPRDRLLRAILGMLSSDDHFTRERQEAQLRGRSRDRTLRSSATA
jgi:ArsR family transcriptional regulator